MTDFFIPKKTTTEHWYKEPWMLLVLGGPLIVVIAAIVTFYIAWQGSDKVLTKDYYKQGLNIDKDIHRDAKAFEYKILANVQLDANSGKTLLHLEGETKLPPFVLLSISSSSSASVYEAVQQITLSQVTPGIYEGLIKIPSPPDTRDLQLWHVKIEAADWRLTADWHDPLHSALQIKKTY
jgi:hypothetical protein